MVPEGWKPTKLGDISSLVTSGSRDWAKFYSDSGSKFIRMTNLRRDGIHLKMDDLKFVNIEAGSADGKRTSLQAGDILISITAELGKIGWVPPGLGEAYINQHTALVRVEPTESESKFVAYLLSSKPYHRRINALNDAGAKAGLNLATIRSLPIALPDIPEQKKIAQILSTWDQAITATERLLANSQKRKKGLMQQLLAGKKRLVDMSTVPSHGDFKPSKSPYRHLPSNWAEVTLSNVSSLITKGATPTTYGFEWQDSGIPFIRSECVSENGFRASGLAHICRDAHEAMGRSKVFNGDILITITGNVGRVCMLPERFEEANINQHIAKITLDGATVDRDFVFQCLQDRKYRVQFERITTGQAYPQISLVQVRDTIIPMPPLDEQRKIALVLSTADHEISALKLRLSALRQEKHALMQQLLTGKRRVNVETEAA